MKVKRRPPPAPHIPFISLADIAWQIIIFFLVAATFAQNDSLNLDSPSSTNDPSPSQSKTITVQASAQVVTVNGEIVDFNALQDRIKALLSTTKKDSERLVVLTAADDVPFQRDADILYAIQKAGGIIVMSEEGSGENPKEAN